MSRPPVPHPSTTRPNEPGDLSRLEYLPAQYADLLALEEDLAVDRLGRPLPPPDAPPSEPDVARTFMELSALVGHVLAVYQRQYAAEAYLSTARAGSSLVRHARRLAYEPDPGLAATGHVVLFAKDGVSGTVDAGLALASVPLGEQSAQDYETRGALAVDAALNTLEPLGATEPVVIATAATTLRLAGTGHGLEAGDLVAFIGPQWRGLVVKEVEEAEDRTTTTVTFDRPLQLSSAVTVSAADPPQLLSRPGLRLRPFAADADPALYPPALVQTANPTSEAATATTPQIGYEVSGYNTNDVYLSEQVPEPLGGNFVIRRRGADLFALRVVAESTVGVTLRRTATITVTVRDVTVTQSGTTWTTTTAPKQVTETVRSHIGATVTAIRVTDGQSTVPRPSQPFPAEFLTGWGASAELAAGEPSTDPVPESLSFAGELAQLTPGRALVFTDRAGTAAEVVTVRRTTVGDGITNIWWDPTGEGAPPSGGWVLGDLLVHANVASVSHGRTVRETLGGSDGVTPFQRFELKEAPVSVLPSVAGGDPALEVRVDGVLWERVRDFHDSGPDARHFRSETDEEGVTTVVFGDGRNGAVPPSGDKNVTGAYRVGLGRDGDVEPHRLSRIKRAHLLLARADNLTAVAGGTGAADPGAVRAQATRYIRTFDRAVSVTDVADLALTIPGIARAAARWDQSLGIRLTVATATGATPPALDVVRAFLDARRDVSVPLTLVEPEPRELRIVVDLEADPAWLVEAVEQSIREALHGTAEDAPGMFTFPARDLGQPAFRSEVYARLEALPGVIGVTVTTFQAVELLSGAHPVEAADVVTAAEDQWLHLSPAELTITALGGAA